MCYHSIVHTRVLACALGALLCSCSASSVGTEAGSVSPSESPASSAPSTPEQSPSLDPSLRAFAPSGEFKVGTVGLWNSSLVRWHGRYLFIAVAHPSGENFYALDLARVPEAKEACTDVEGSGTRVDEATNAIFFDCPDRSIYARFTKLGEPSPSNIATATSLLPAYRLVVTSDGMLGLSDDRLSVNELASLWGG
jgi:hypothetical protein